MPNKKKEILKEKSSEDALSSTPLRERARSLSGVETTDVENPPYEIPEHWKWVRLGSLAKINPPKEKLDWNDEQLCSFIPMKSVSEFQQEVVEIEKEYYKKLKTGYTQFKGGDIIFAKITPCMENGKVAILPKLENTYGFGSTEFYVLRVENSDTRRYIFRLIASSYFRDKAKGFMKGAVGQLRVPKDFLSEYLFPLPPLEEQKRIVARLDSMLGKLKEAKKLIEEARETFKDRRSAILAKAFRGELTAKWREENPNVESAEVLLEKIAKERGKVTKKVPFQLPKTWKWVDFSYVATIKSNLVEPKSFPNLPHIAPDNIEKETGKLLPYRTVKEDNLISAKHFFKKNQIIYSKIRPYLSKVIIAPFDGLCSADMYPIETDLDRKFLWYFMLSNIFLNYASNAGSRVLLPKINQQGLNIIPLPIPPLEEQKEIVRQIESLFAKEDEAKELLDMEEQIELLEKAILAMAFRGELG